MIVHLAAALWAYLRPLSVVHAWSVAVVRAAGMSRRSVRIDGHRIEYLTGGSGPPLVMIHGIGGKAEDYALLFRHFTRRHRVYALDLLGSGGSDTPDVDYSIAMHAGVLRGFLDAMDLRTTDVMAVSMGGWIALKFAAEHPERVRRLALVSTGGFAFETEALTESTFSPRDIAALRRSLYLQSDRAARLPKFVLRDLLRRARERRWINERAMRSMLTGRDLVERKLGALRMPVLLVWGTRDRLIPFSVAHRIRDEVPHAELFAIEGGSHLAVIERRREAVPAILDFFR
ncbi:MAG TPA: alpha/beta fold hydrolase [Thermoanaerobaculia bacterium]|nr:alpha/beta fold hydrolase [Thermoanaerobaculia bacterium]